MTSPKEDQQPMTTREEALAKAAQDFIDKVDRGEARSVKSYAAFNAALRLASRQEVSVTVEELASIYGQTLATDLLANYAITNRTEG